MPSHTPNLNFILDSVPLYNKSPGKAVRNYTTSTYMDGVDVTPPGKATILKTPEGVHYVVYFAQYFDEYCASILYVQNSLDGAFAVFEMTP